MNLYIIITYKAKKKVKKFANVKNEEKVMSPQPRKFHLENIIWSSS